MTATEVEQDGAGGSRGAEAVAAWLASGERLEQYCERTGQSVWSLRRWRREHAERFGIAVRRRTGVARRRAPEGNAAMIPVEIGNGAMAAAATTTIEVRLQGQRSIVVSYAIDGATLARLIAAVEAAR